MRRLRVAAPPLTGRPDARVSAVAFLVGVLSLALATALAGCGGGQASSAGDPGVDYSKLGVAVPSPSTSYATPQPPGDAPGDAASPTKQILYDLRTRVVRTAGVSVETEAKCAAGVITGTVDQTVTCKVIYQGMTVSYRVQITGGTPTFSWVASTETSVLTEEGVRRAYWAKHSAESTAVRCDKMPTQKLVDLGHPTDFRCYHKASAGWREHAVLLKDGGIKFVAPES